MLAAEVETGAIAALRDEVITLGKEALDASAHRVPSKDVEHRDRRGRFTVTYNRKRRRKRGEAVASYLRSAEEKAEGRVPSWPRFVRERPDTIEAKLRTLVFEPLVSRVKGWAGLRSPDAAALKPLTGYAYMPSTLAKLTSALAISNAGPRLLETAGPMAAQSGRDTEPEGPALSPNSLFCENKRVVGVKGFEPSASWSRTAPGNSASGGITPHSPAFTNKTSSGESHSTTSTPPAFHTPCHPVVTRNPHAVRLLEGGAANLLSVRQVAERLDVCTATIYKLCKRGALPHVRVSNAIRITPEALHAFIAAQSGAKRKV